MPFLRFPGLLAASVAALAAFGAGDDGATGDAERWNACVGMYERGEITNALAAARELVGRIDPDGRVSRVGRQAAELAAKICYDRAHGPDAGEGAQAWLDEAARDAQLVLRAENERRAGADDLGRANRNFTRATDGLAALRETSRVNRILKAAQGRDPGELLQAAVAESRSLMKETSGYLTNPAPQAVAMSTAFVKRAERLAETWIPVREAITRSVTNEEESATIVARIDQAAQKTDRLVTELEDMSEDAWSTVADAERDFTEFFKMTAMPPTAMREDQVVQSNAWLDVETVNDRSWQRDALDFTRGFRAKFPAWARAYEQQAQADTNRPPFTAEAQARISDLSTQLEKLQLECCNAPDPALQEDALEIIRQILELLPKDGGGRQGQPPPQQQDRRDQQGQGDRDRQQDQDGGESKDDRQGADEQPQEEPKDDGEKDGDGRDDPDEREVEAVLKKAQERSDEHEADKKARMKKIPLPPSERDW